MPTRPGLRDSASSDKPAELSAGAAYCETCAPERPGRISAMATALHSVALRPTRREGVIPAPCCVPADRRRTGGPRCEGKRSRLPGESARGQRGARCTDAESYGPGRALSTANWGASGAARRRGGNAGMAAEEEPPGSPGRAADADAGPAPDRPAGPLGGAIRDPERPAREVEPVVLAGEPERPREIPGAAREPR